jgi:hypothetical protein
MPAIKDSPGARRYASNPESYRELIDSFHLFTGSSELNFKEESSKVKAHLLKDLFFYFRRALSSKRLCSRSSFRLEQH